MGDISIWKSRILMNRANWQNVQANKLDIDLKINIYFCVKENFPFQ